MILDAGEIAGDQREQVTGLWKRVVPADPVTITGFAAIDTIAIRQQQRTGAALGMDFGAEHGHHVGSIQVVGNVAKALGFALGAEITVGQVEAFQAGIGGGIDLDFAADLETVGKRADRQAIITQPIVLR